MKRVVLTLALLSASALAIGSTPLRLEVGAATDERLAVKGMVDISKRCALRLCLLELRLAFPADDHWSIKFGVPQAPEVALLNDLAFVYSPWRGDWKVEPYCFSGAGFAYDRFSDSSHVTERFTLTMPFGAGVERLLFFWRKAPSVFLEGAVALGGSQIVVHGPLPGPYSQPLFPELTAAARLAVGIRI